MSDQVESSSEIEEFLQQVTSVRQNAQRRFLGGFQETASFDQERDYQEIVDLAGSSVVTEVWAKESDGIWVTSDTDKPSFTRYYAEWRYPTVALWKRLGPDGQNPFDQEKRVWKVFLIKSSIVQDPLEFYKDQLSKEYYQSILNFSPPVIPTLLVKKFLKTTILSRQELSRIERECMELWRKEGGSVKHPHPILKDVILAMGLYERFGIATWSNINDVHVKIYAVIRKVMECYSVSQSLNIQEEAIRQKAIQQAGIGHLIGNNSIR